MQVTKSTHGNVQPMETKAFQYSNPVVRGNSPDPTIIRVGPDYFLAVSSFEYLPGLVIRHSTDLVNWRIIGAGVTRPAQYRRDRRPGAIMLFAPTLRFHQGRFYLVCTNMADGQGNFMLTTTDIAGDWSDAIWLDREAFDPSLFFDRDGTCYYTRRSLDLSVPGGDLGPVMQGVLDVATGHLGPLRPTTPGPRGFLTNDIEGPHLYLIGDWYYLSAAEGSTWIGHMQTIGRSRSPWGPFEPAPHNPVITHRNRVLHPIQTLGHADLVEDPSGNWWALCLGTRHRKEHHNLGRETFLLPVAWRDGWPYIGTDGGTELQVSCDHSAETGGAARGVGRTLLTEGWHMLGQPPTGLAMDADSIDLPYGADVGDATPDVPAGALLRFQTEEVQVFSARVPDPVPGGATGIGAYADATHRFDMTLRHEAGARVLWFRRQVDDVVSESCHVVVHSGAVNMAIHADAEVYRFVITVGGVTTEIGGARARLLSAESCEWFVGVNFALIAVGPPGESVQIPRFDAVRLT